MNCIFSGYGDYIGSVCQLINAMQYTTGNELTVRFVYSNVNNHDNIIARGIIYMCLLFTKQSNGSIVKNHRLLLSVTLY